MPQCSTRTGVVSTPSISASCSPASASAASVASVCNCSAVRFGTLPTWDSPIPTMAAASGSRFTSIHLEFGGLCDLGPFCQLVAYVSGEFLRRAGDGDGSERVEALLGVRQIDHLDDGGVELADYVLRRSRRRQNAVPAGH